ncbi:hypothetical protein BHM03_00047005 [Ensete ventricosum]|nr:hypothetical protein BHM03_00047005 [Ensete ventricosum]
MKEPVEKHPFEKEPEAAGKKLAGEYPIGTEEQLGKQNAAPPVPSHPWGGGPAATFFCLKSHQSRLG